VFSEAETLNSTSGRQSLPRLLAALGYAQDHATASRRVFRFHRGILHAQQITADAWRAILGQLLAAKLGAFVDLGSQERADTAGKGEASGRHCGSSASQLLALTGKACKFPTND
jgi:hypothetical protein